jgi:putative flippase GtrA
MWLWLNNTPPGNAWPFWLRARRDDRRRGLAGQAARFLLIGVISTVAYVLLYLLLRTVMAAQAANAISLLVTAVANTAANRRVTFGIRGRRHVTRHQVRGLIAFGIGLGLTSGALVVLHTAVAQPSRAAELAVLVAANLAATVVRFWLYRQWVFGARRDRSPGRAGSAPPGADTRETAFVRVAASPGGDAR